ncbi:fiber [Polar bear adenovirus 1]|uniref:Fiber n=1 Tax=Polar bear adenovirus 1 TaxID=2250215 RepID=A0A2Z4QJC1_9ADEN|nr:fiber [Polar bear adenovirus 1]
MKRAGVDFNPVYPYKYRKTEITSPAFFDSRGFKESPPGFLKLSTIAPLAFTDNGELTVAIGSGIAISRDGKLERESTFVTPPLSVADDTITLDLGPGLETNVNSALIPKITDPLALKEEGITLNVNEPLQVRDSKLSITTSNPITCTDSSLTLSFAKPLKLEDAALGVGAAPPLNITDEGALGLSIDSPLEVGNRGLSVRTSDPLTLSEEGISLKTISPITVTTDGVTVTAKEPLHVTEDGLALSAASPLHVHNKHLALKLSEPFRVVENGLAMTLGQGLKLVNGALTMQLDDSLNISALGLGINTHAPITVGVDGVSCALGVGLGVDSDAICIKTQPPLDKSADGVYLNTGKGMVVKDGKLTVDPVLYPPFQTVWTGTDVELNVTDSKQEPYGTFFLLLNRSGALVHGLVAFQCNRLDDSSTPVISVNITFDERGHIIENRGNFTGSLRLKTDDASLQDAFNPRKFLPAKNMYTSRTSYRNFCVMRSYLEETTKEGNVLLVNHRPTTLRIYFNLDSEGKPEYNLQFKWGPLSPVVLPCNLSPTSFSYIGED